MMVALLKLWTTLASSVLGVVCCLVSSGTQLLLLFQNPVLVLGGLALTGPDTRIASPKIANGQMREGVNENEDQ
jgi:hypothetical protein